MHDYSFPVEYEYSGTGTGYIDVEAESYLEAKTKFLEMMKIPIHLDIQDMDNEVTTIDYVIYLSEDPGHSKDRKEFDPMEGPEDEIEEPEEHKNTIEEDLELGQTLLFNN